MQKPKIRKLELSEIREICDTAISNYKDLNTQQMVELGDGRSHQAVAFAKALTQVLYKQGEIDFVVEFEAERGKP